MRIGRRTKLLLYGGNLWYLAEGMLGPLFAVFTERIGGDILDISHAWATYLMVTGIFYIIVGRIADGKKIKRKLMVSGYALNALFTFGYLLVSTTWHLFIIQIGLGIAAAMATPTWNALYGRHGDEHYDTFKWGLAGGEAQIITGFALIIGGFIVSYFSFTSLFITMGIIQVIATLYITRILKD